MNPYWKFPRRLFLWRMIGPSVGVMIVAFFFTGVLAQLDSVRAIERRHSTLVAPAKRLPIWPAPAAIIYTGRVLSYWTNIPYACSGNNAVNDFQKEQCADFWLRVQVGTAILLFPLGAAIFFLFVGLDQLRILYRRCEQLSSKGQASFKGIVPRHIRSGVDVFGWFFCLRIIQLKVGGEYVLVYYPADAPNPLPNQTFAVFDAGRRFGRRRLIAALHAPHMAVISDREA